MRTTILFIVALSGCTISENKKHEPFPVLNLADPEWTSYEGSWTTNDRRIYLELSLKTAITNNESSYHTKERYNLEDKEAGAVSSWGNYSVYYGLPGNAIGIRLYNLARTPNEIYYWRTEGTNQKDYPDEMYFLTHGENELFPCDKDFNPITTDKRYTLHKRSNLFTVEGYVSFEEDRAEFFERNTMERWNVAELGEFNTIKKMYLDSAKEKYEGIYLKALAFSITDTTLDKIIVPKRNTLVLKKIKNFGKDPD
jgi:hypothetical protein